MTRIEMFAHDTLGTILTKHQIKLITAWANGQHLMSGRQAGVSTARAVMLAWVQEGLKEMPNHEVK